DDLGVGAGVGEKAHRERWVGSGQWPVMTAARPRRAPERSAAGEYNTAGSRPDNRRRASGGGKSGLRRAVCQLTAGRREPTESATENEPPKSRKGPARVKRCGKSAPRPWQQGRHGKPHTEQGQIGKVGSPQQCAALTRGPRAFRVGCWRRRVTAVLEEWLSRRRKALDRTRLIGRLPTFFHGRTPGVPPACRNPVRPPPGLHRASRPGKFPQRTTPGGPAAGIYFN